MVWGHLVRLTSGRPLVCAVVAFEISIKLIRQHSFQKRRTDLNAV